METRDKIMSGIECCIIHFLDRKFVTIPENQKPLDLEEISRETMIPLGLIQKNIDKIEQRGYLSRDTQDNYFLPKI